MYKLMVKKITISTNPHYAIKRPDGSYVYRANGELALFAVREIAQAMVDELNRNIRQKPKKEDAFESWADKWGSVFDSFGQKNGGNPRWN